MKTKRLIDDFDAVVDEMVKGMLAAHPRHLCRAEGHHRAHAAVDGPRPGKAGIVVSGGSGHEPTPVGLVGRSLADAVAVGKVFASPPPDRILRVTSALKMAALDGIEVRTVVTINDVASAPPERRAERRDITGNAFVLRWRARPPMPCCRSRRLDEERREGDDQRGEAGGQVRHGGVSWRKRRQPRPPARFINPLRPERLIGQSRAKACSLGHVDSGATSAALILKTLAAAL